jgi:hypothetical protein
MTYQEALKYLTESSQPLVRINPKYSQSGAPHWMRGRLLEVLNDKTCLLQPMGHRKPERFPLEGLKPWKSKQSVMTLRR